MKYLTALIVLLFSSSVLAAEMNIKCTSEDNKTIEWTMTFQYGESGFYKVSGPIELPGYPKLVFVGDYTTAGMQSYLDVQVLEGDEFINLAVNLNSEEGEITIRDKNQEQLKIKKLSECVRL